MEGESLEFESRCRALLERRRTEAFGVSFHLASTEPQMLLSSYASAHHALALFHLDRDLALNELRALYAACQHDDGRLALERACSDDDREARIAQLGPIYDDERSALVGPPVAAFVAAQFALQCGEQARDLLECATRHLDSIWGERLPPDTPLPVILHPLESGAPGSPLFDSMIEAEDLEEWRDEAVNLVRSATACQLDPERALRAGHPFVVEDPTFCGWLLVALEEASLAWKKLGDGATEQKMRIRSEMIADGIAKRLWWDQEEIYSGFDRQRDTGLRVVTAGGLIPMASRLLQQEGSARRAMGRYLRPSASPLWGKHGISYNPIASDSDDADAAASEIPWRGNAISPLSHGWAHLALLRADRTSDARTAREQVEDLALAQGFHEFYDALSGDPRLSNGSDGFTAAVIGLEMRSREEAE